MLKQRAQRASRPQTLQSGTRKDPIHLTRGYKQTFRGHLREEMEKMVYAVRDAVCEGEGANANISDSSRRKKILTYLNLAIQE